MTNRQEQPKTYRQIYNEQKKSASLGCPQGILSSIDESVVLNYIANNPNDPDVVRYKNKTEFEKLPEVLKKFRAMEEIRGMDIMNPKDPNTIRQMHANIKNPAYIYGLNIYSNSPDASAEYRENYRRAFDIMKGIYFDNPSVKDIRDEVQTYEDNHFKLELGDAVAAGDYFHKTESPDERTKNVTEEAMTRLKFSTGIDFEGFSTALENAKRKTLGITRADSPEMKRVKDALKKVVEISKGGNTNLIDAKKACNELLQAADSYVNNPSKAKNDRYELVSRIKALISSDIKNINDKEDKIKEKISERIKNEINAEKEKEKEKENVNKTAEKAEVKTEPEPETEKVEVKPEPKPETEKVEVEPEPEVKSEPEKTEVKAETEKTEVKPEPKKAEKPKTEAEKEKEEIEKLAIKHAGDGLTERGAENIVKLRKISEEARNYLVGECDWGQPVKGGDELKDVFSYEITQKMLSIGNKDGSYNKMFSLLNSDDFLTRYREEFSGPSFNQQCNAVFKPETLKRALTFDNGVFSRLTTQAVVQAVNKMKSAPAVTSSAQPHAKDPEIDREKEGVSNGPKFG